MDKLGEGGGVEGIGQDEEAGSDLIAMWPNIKLELPPLGFDVKFSLQVPKWPRDEAEELAEETHGDNKYGNFRACANTTIFISILSIDPEVRNRGMFN